MNNSPTKFEERYYILQRKSFSKSPLSALEDKVAIIFEKALEELENKQDFRILRNIYFKTSSSYRFELDLLLLYKESPLAVIDVTRDQHSLYRHINQLHRNCNILNSGYCFGCYGDKFILFKNNDNLYKLSDNDLSVNNILEAIKTSIILGENDNHDVTEEMIYNHFKQIVDSSQVEEDIKNNLKGIISNAKNGAFENSTFTLDAEIERNLILALLGKFTENICRYTSLASIFRTLNSKEQSMCSIVCMNDKSETQYASKKISYDILESKRQVNNCYILSCANDKKSDNLTMWRLYGDDGKGVCIKYKVKTSIIGRYSAFAMAPISYADDQGNDKKLELIRKLLNEKTSGVKFKLREWNIWQHFFKPYAYKDESEIRLLFWNECDQNESHEEDTGKHPKFNRKWILESSFEIVAPIVCFDISTGTFDFPLEIESIIVGPKNKEKEENQTQLTKMAKAKGLCDDANDNYTTISSIEHYR